MSTGTTAGAGEGPEWLPTDHILRDPDCSMHQYSESFFTRIYYLITHSLTVGLL